jgi:hypothetical protein
MSLNESPVDVNLMARVHSALRERLNNNPRLKRIVPESILRGSMEEKHLEYWIIKEQEDKPWIFITIGQLYHPITTGTYAVQVISTIPPSTWEGGDYIDLKKKLEITDPDSSERDYQFEQYMSSEISRLSYSEGVVLRDPSEKAITKKAFETYINLISEVNRIESDEINIAESLKKAMSKYKSNR